MRSHLEAAAFREGGYLKIYIISSFGQATCSDFPALGLCGILLTNPPTNSLTAWSIGLL